MSLAMFKYFQDKVTSFFIHRAGAVMFAVLIMAANVSVLAETPLDIATLYPATKTFTITSCGNGTHFQMYASSSTATTLSCANKTGNDVSTDANYRFAFVPDDKGNYYLYNVGTKTFVTSVNGNTSAYLRDGNSTLSPVYVYNPNPNNNHLDSHLSDTAKYCRVLAFNNSNLTYATSNSGNNSGLGSGNANNTNHILAIGATSGTATITDWNWIGKSGFYSISIAEVSDFPFTNEDLKEAQAKMKSYTSTTTEALNLKTNTVYTFKTKGGATLYANGNNISATTDASSISDVTNTYFVLVPDAANTNNVYLYSVGQKKYLNLNRSLVDGSTVYTNIAAPLHFYSTNDTDYPFALTLSDSWAGGSLNLNVTGNNVNFNNSANVSDGNMLTATVVANAVFDATEASKHLTAMNDYSYKSLKDVWLTPNTVRYTLRTTPNADGGFRGGLYADGSGLTTTFKANVDTLSTDENQQFAFITKSADDTSAYIYNVGQEKFVSGTSASQSPEAMSTNPNPVYVARTNNCDYSVAFSFNNAVSWGNGNVDNGLFLSINRGNGVMVGSYGKMDDNGSRFQATNVGTFTDEELAAARSFLNGYEKSTFAAESLTTDNKVYTLESETGGKLYANGSGVTINTTANSSDANTQFMFYTDSASTEAEKKVYLYSVGQRTFVTPSMGYGSKSTAGAVTVYSTKDTHGYKVAFKLGDYWLNTAGNANATDPDKSNRFQAEEVETPDSNYSYAEARTIFNGVYTLSSLKALSIDPNKVYFLTSDNFTTTINGTRQSGHIVPVGIGSNLNWNTQVQATSYTANDAPAGTYFAFVTDEKDSTVYYLYSVNVQAAATKAGSLVTGTGKQRIYVYATNDRQYPLAIGFTDTWDATGASNLDASQNNNSDKLISTTTTPSASKRWKLTEVPGVTTYNLAQAREALEEFNRQVKPWQAGLSVSSVFSISSNRHVWYAGSTQLYTAAPNTQVDSSMVDYLFAFVTDSNTGDMYLYNVGQKKFVSKNNKNAFLTGDEDDSLFIYRTYDDTYPYLLAFCNNLTNFSNGNGNDNNTYHVISTTTTNGGSFNISDYTVPDDGNKVRFTPISGVQFSIDDALAILHGNLPHFHFRGASGRPFMTNGMQDVGEVHYYYYVDTRRRQYGTKNNADRAAIDLQLPFKRYLARSFNDTHDVLYTSTKDNYSGSSDVDHASNGNNYEPKAYIRWYNYHTDTKMSEDRLIPWRASENNLQSGADGSNNLLASSYSDNRGRALGLFARRLSQTGPDAALVGTAYVIPTAANDSTWAGDTIACDVSFYTDDDVPMNDDGTIRGDYSRYNQSANGPFQHEPTLSTRYIFHILPAKKIANDLRTALLSPVRGHTSTLADRGVFSFGAKDNSATMALRISLPDVPNYYFWPVSDPNTHHVYHKFGDKYGITDNDLQKGTDPVEGAYIEYRIYSSDSLHWRRINISRSKMTNISVNSLNGTDWKNLDGKQTATDSIPTIRIGSTCFLVGLVWDKEQKQACPFFNARLDISNNAPVSADTINSGRYPNRTNNYLENHFGSPVAQFTFDNENTLLTLSNPHGNFADYSVVPYNFAKRDYSFLYIKELLGLKQDSTPQLPGRFRNVNYNGSAYLLHGDYDLVKEITVDNQPMYDMLHSREPSQYGYFMVTDASDESRSLSSQDFQGSLCSGSQIIVSAWVRNTSSGRYQENRDNNNVNAAPELRFTLLGVEKDKDDNDISTKEFAALCTGDFATNINNFVYTNGYPRMNSKDWFQVFGTITLPANSGIENYGDFRIVVDNFCNTADGADYAIDDIFVYQSNSKVEVLQDPPLCNETDAAKRAVKIKIRADYSTARQLTDAENGDKRVYYRFCKPDDRSVYGIPVTGKDFYGAGHDTCGVAIVPMLQSDTAHLEKDNGEGSKFENNASGILNVILANRSFELSPDSTYFVSLALEEDGKPGTWGRPSSLCSFYSDNFGLVRQNIYFNGITTPTNFRQFVIPCGVNESSDYSGIKASITAPSHISTGSVTLTGLPFHWFAGSVREYQRVKDASNNYLKDAVEAYIRKYPGQPYKEENPVDNGSEGYTAAYKALIKANLYSESNRSGKLLMNAADSLTTIPLKLGRDTVTAVAATDTTLVNGVKYTLCLDPMELYLQMTQNGPGLTFGMANVAYPSSETMRSLRIGLPQLKRMKAKGEGDRTGNKNTAGILTIPIQSVSFEGTVYKDEALEFLGYNDDVTRCDSIYISDTNDPSIDLESAKDTYFGKLTATTLAGGATSLSMYIANCDMIHEGYEYVLMFKFKSTNYGQGRTQCAGESFLRLRVVPEYVTWSPTADNGLNSNWNNDLNWVRSTAADLYRADYKDYGKPTYKFTLHDRDGNPVAGKTDMWNTVVDTTIPADAKQPSSYVPMYFTKVLIPTMASQRYPMLGYISHQSSNGLVQSLVNLKQHVATTNIRYDMMASPANGDSTAFDCSVFDGNVCEQIHFNTGAQLRNEQYLKYDRAWCELSLPMGVWGTFTTPMDHSIAADMYVPKVTGRQTTPLFEEIRFTDRDAVDENGLPFRPGVSGEEYGLYGKAGDTMYNRIRMPVYQKLWGENASMHDERGERGDSVGNYSAYDNPYLMLIYPNPSDGDMEMRQNVNANNYNVWSHTFNFLANDSVYGQTWSHSINGIYDDAYGVAGKIGDEFSIPSVDVNPTGYAVMRLPKADTSFKYYRVNDDGTFSQSEETVDVTRLRDKNYRLGVSYSSSSDDLGEVRLTTAALQPEASLAFVRGATADDGYPLYIKNSVGNIVFTKDSLYGITPGAEGSIASTDTTSIANGLVYDLVGNPYTSAISVREFIRGNQNIFRKVERNGRWVYRIWSLVGDKLYEYSDSNANAVIQPGQSIFIKIQRPGIDVVTFTTRMQTDPNITEGALAVVEEPVAPAKTYTINDKTDIKNVVDHGVDTHVYVWSPYAGTLAVSGETIRRVEIYNISGQVVETGSMSGSEKRFSVGSGIYIVRATLEDGTTESRKVAVK